MQGLEDGARDAATPAFKARQQTDQAGWRHGKEEYGSHEGRDSQYADARKNQGIQPLIS